MEFRWFVQTNTTLFLVFHPNRDRKALNRWTTPLSQIAGISTRSSPLQAWLKEPASLDSRWQIFSEGFQLGYEETVINLPGLIQTLPSEVGDYSIEKHARLYGAIYAYWDIGILRVLLILKDEIPENPGSVWTTGF